MANVRVALRVRPLSKREIAEGARVILNVDDKIARIKNIKLDHRADGCGDTRERLMEFGFDYCYCSVDPDDPKYASQEVVFQDLGTTVLSEAIKGYNVCLFAYGQTGSGKTYTMMGTPTSVGLTPRICEGLFCYNADSLGVPSSCRIEVSFLEIYNERVRDLLHQADQKKPYTLRVREHPEKGPYVQGLSQHVVTSYEQVVALLEEGIENRITAATHIHDASSRSHAIFTIQYTQAILEDNLPSEIISKVNLVDLAGSERASPNYCKDRLTEGSNINRSLVTLGIVISALAQNSQMSSSCQSINSIISDGDSGIQGSSPSGSSISGSKRQPFVPYRDSILTWLLKDSLGGNSKTIMIATVSPASISYNETMSTLRYASNAKNIINKPRVNEDASVKLIRELREEINRLKAMLRNFEMRATSPAFSEEREGNLTELVRQNELKIEQLTKDWTDKWTDKAALMEQYNVDINHGKARVTIDSGLPHLIAMDDDILSTGVVIYHLKEGTTDIGKGDHDIVLQGELIEQDHCVIENNFGVVELRPVSGAFCTVNGQEVTDVCRLSQGAIIVLGRSHRFRFNHPAEAAVLRQMRSDSQASFVSDSSLDWLDLSGDYSSSKENSLTFNTSTEIVSEEYQQRIRELESSYQQQVEEQQRYVEDLKRQIQVAQVKGEKELEQEQTLLNQQIEENQQWLVKEKQRLTAVFQQRKESAAQTESKTYAEVEIQNCVRTEIQPSPEELKTKQLLQLELLRKCSLRRAERNIRRKRVNFQLERIVKKQKLLEAKKTLQQLEAACWINEDALKPTYQHIPKLQGPVVPSPSLNRTRSSPSIFSYYRRRSLPWTLQTLPTYSALLKRKCKSELFQKAKTRESKKPLRALPIDCLKALSTCGSCDEVDDEPSIVGAATSQAEKRTINLLLSHRNSSDTLFPSDPQMSKKRQKMDKAGGRSRGLSSCPTEPPKKRNIRAVVNTGTKDTKLKSTKNQSQPTVGISRKNTALERSKPTVKTECVKSPPEKYAKNIQRSTGPGKIPPREAFTVKGAKGNITTPMPNSKTKPIHVANKISSSVDNIPKLNKHPEDHHVTNRRWMSTDRLNRGLMKSSLQRLEQWKEDESSESSDGESFYSVDSLSSAYASALNEQLKQEEKERQKYGRRDSDSEDSQMSQDSLLERENKKKRPNKQRYTKYKTIVSHSSPSKSLTEDHNSFPLVTTGSMTTGFSKSFSLDSLADADDVPDVDSSEELPAEIFWKLQSPRCLNMNDDQKNVDITTTGENTALERSASFYLKMNEGVTMGKKDTSTQLNVPDLKTQQIHPSPSVFSGECALPGSPREKCTVESDVNAPHQDFSNLNNLAAKTDSDCMKDERKEGSPKTNVDKSRPSTCSDIQEELNAKYCPDSEPLHKNLNMYFAEENQPNTSYSKKPVDECICSENDCSSKPIGEFSTSKDQPNVLDLSHNFPEGEQNTQKSVPNVEKKDVALELIGFAKDDANSMRQLLLEPTTDEESSKDTTVSVKTPVNKDFKMSVETCSQYIQDTHKESVEPKKVSIKANREQKNVEELTEMQNQDMKQNTFFQLPMNETVSEISHLDEECKPRQTFVLQENDKMHDHADVTMKSFDQNVLQVGSTSVQTDYLNNQTAVLSDTCPEVRYNTLEIEKIQNLAGITNELQADQQIHTEIANTNLLLPVTTYTATLDLNGNRDCKLKTQQSLSDKDSVCENKTIDPFQRLINDGIGRIVADNISDVSTVVLIANRPLSAARNISHSVSVQQSDTINVSPLAMNNSLLQLIKNLGKHDSPAFRSEVGSVDSHKDTESNVQDSEQGEQLKTSPKANMEVTRSSPLITTIDIPPIENPLPSSGTSPNRNIPKYNCPNHKESRVSECCIGHPCNVQLNDPETFQLSVLSDKICKFQHENLDINSNEQGTLWSSCVDNAGQISSFHSTQCLMYNSSGEVLIQEKDILIDKRMEDLQSQQVHGLQTKPLRLHYDGNPIDCKNDTPCSETHSGQFEETCPSGQEVHTGVKTPQLFIGTKNDNQDVSSGLLPSATDEQLCKKHDGEDTKNSFCVIDGQNDQVLRIESFTCETKGSFPHEQIRKNNENDENAYCDTDEGALEAQPEDPSPVNKQVMIKHDIFEKETDKDHGKGALKEKQDKHVTATQDLITFGRSLQKQIGNTVTDNKEYNSADTCHKTNNMQENHPCVDQPLTQNYGSTYPILPYYDAVMQHEHIPEQKFKTELESTHYKNTEIVPSKSELKQSLFELKNNVEGVKGESQQLGSFGILKCKEEKMFFKPKNGKSGLSIAHGTEKCATKNENTERGSAASNVNNVVIPKQLHGFNSGSDSSAEVDDHTFGSHPDRPRNLYGRFKEESEPIDDNIGKESYQTKDHHFSVKAQEGNLLVQEMVDKLPTKKTITQKLERPLAQDKLEEKTTVNFLQNLQNSTCKSESVHPVLAYSTNACTLPTVASSVNSSQGIEEPNEAQNDVQNNTSKCQYKTAQLQQVNEQTDISLGCQQSSFRPCQETCPTEKAEIDYGSSHISETSICTTSEFEHNLKSKLSLLMDKSTLKSTEMLDTNGVNVISGQSDPSLQAGYRSKENGVQNNICTIEANCGKYPSELNRSPGISSGEDDTETSSSLVSSGLTSFKIGSLENLSVVNECKPELDGTIDTEEPWDFSHHTVSEIHTSPCTMSNKKSCMVGESVPFPMAESHLIESPKLPPNGSTLSLKSESFPQTLVSSTITMCNIQDDSQQAQDCSVNAPENTAAGHAHIKDDGNDDKSYITNIQTSNFHSSLFCDASLQTQISVEEMVENTEGLHFSSSDINPFVHSWQQEVSPRAGWRNCSFNSASDVSCTKFQTTADKLIRCSSVNEGLNSHSSPFNSHLSSYANAKQASSTISSFGGNDSRQDLNSLDGFQAHLLDENYARNDIEFDGTSGSQVRFEDYSQLDEIMILYTSESETCNENDQIKSYEHRTHTKPRYRRTTKHQRSNTDVSSSRQIRHQKPVSWSNVQSMSLHLSQLLHETSQLLGNLSQHHPENIPFDAIGLQKDAAESFVKKSVKDSFTQTYEDKGIQTDKPNNKSTQNYGTESNSFLSPSEINVIVKLVGADSSTHIQHNSNLTEAQNSDRKPKVRTQSLPNLQDYVPSKPVEHESKSSNVRASAPFLNGLKDMSSRSLQISSARSGPLPVIYKDSGDISPAVNNPSSGVGQTVRCQAASQGNTMMVDRASSPILTLRASRKHSDNFGPENHSDIQMLEKISQHKKRRERRNHDLQFTSSPTETDSESIFSSGQENRKNEFEGGLCRSLRESPKRRIATHKVQKYRSEGCILQNNQFTSNSEISGYEDQEDTKGIFRSLQPKILPASTFAALTSWERPQSLEKLSQVASPILERHRQLLPRTTRKDYVSNENDLASTTITSSNSCAKIENYPYSPSQVSGFDLQIQEDGLSVVESECNTDILLGQEPTLANSGQEPTLANSQKSHNYSLQDLPLHNKFSNWSGVQGSLPRNVQLMTSYPNLSMKQSPTNISQEEMESRSREIERLQRERAEIMSAVHLEMNPQPLTVQLAEAKLSYGIGETDALLRVIQTGKMDNQDQISIKKQLYERHMKVIENLRKEREDRLQSFRRSRSLSPQKQLSASQTSLSSLRDSDLPSRRREYLQQLRRDVVDSTRIQEPKKRTAQCPSEIEAMLKDYQKAREEARTEIARARDKLRERAELEKRRLLQSSLQKDDTKMKTLVSTSTLFTNSSLSLSSGPTSGYNSGIATTPAKGNKSTLHEAKTLPMGLDLELGSGRGRSAVRNCYLMVPTQNASVSDPNINQPPPEKTSAAEVSPVHSAHLHGPLWQSTPVLYQDFATQVQASAMTEVMAACSYDLKNLFNGQAAAGWIYQTTEKGVLVYYKAFSSPTKHGFIGAGVIKRPLHNVWDMVKDVHARRLYDQSILSACVHQRVSSTVQLVHVVMDMSLCYLKQPRDFCCITVESREEKCYSLCFQSVYNESMPRPNKDAVRGEILPSAWILQPDRINGEAVTRVIYMVQADLGAPAIPSRLLGVVSKRQPLVISALANFFSR